MPDDAQDPRKKKSLSEISHLFLSSVRDRQTNGAKPPQRTPPPHDESIDLTPEEFAQVYGSAQPVTEPQRKSVPVTALISAHLNGKQFDRVKEYARHLASRSGRVGLIEADASELRLMCFEPGAPAMTTAEPDPASTECAEPRRMSEALEEMNWDVERWLLLLPNPRTCEARALLRDVDHWLLLSTCDHDGVVSSYRMLKGVTETARPRLSLALLDAKDDATVARVYAKLAGVCQQFLEWPLEAEPAVEQGAAVNDYLVLQYRPTRDKAQLAAAPQWGIIAEFLAAARLSLPQPGQPNELPVQEEQPVISVQPSAPEPSLVADVVVPPLRAQQQVTGKADFQPASVADMVIPMPRQAPAAPQAAAPALSFDEVIDLAGPDVGGGSLLSAVLRNSHGTLVECPVRPPMCPDARLAVGREHGIILMAVARQGLGDLRSIGQAYRWMNENRELIGMAMPQFAIDARQAPRLQLFVDRADLSADVLQPMMQSQNVTVQAYRKLRWGEKLGVFLEAA